MLHEYSITWLCDVFREGNLVGGKSLICRDVKHQSRKNFANTSYLTQLSKTKTYVSQEIILSNMFTKTAKDCMCTCRINFFVQRTRNNADGVSSSVAWYLGQKYITLHWTILIDMRICDRAVFFYHLPVHKSNLLLRKLVISASTP